MFHGKHSALTLLHQGLDALIEHPTARWPWGGSERDRAKQRLDRYHDAVMLVGSPDLEGRQVRGAKVLARMTARNNAKKTGKMPTLVVDLDPGLNVVRLRSWPL